MNRTILGLLHPGEMGAAIGQCLTDRGHTVLWVSRGRSPATAERAAAAGLTDAGTVAELARRAAVVLSVCPPHAAGSVADSVRGFGGVYVDANAISPQSARSVASAVGAGGTGEREAGGTGAGGGDQAGTGGSGAGQGGAVFVDGGIIGPPPRPGGAPGAPEGTRLYLSGARAAEIAELFAGTPVGTRIVEGGIGAASAVKMAYAAWTKGTAALVLAARALARAADVEDTLLAEWALSQPSLAGRSERAAESAAAKGWRWDAEMTEIAASMAGAGLPAGFHLAAAEIFGRVPRAGSATVDQVLAALTGQGAG
jgi:3-hydroxyisobutyrate dehydrogenase-like beta-hydroxyacid dehydrogenase